MEQMRSEGSLKPNSFVAIRHSEDGQFAQPRIEDFGDAEKYLSSSHMRNAVRRLIPKGIIGGHGEHYGGWLGEYYKKLAEPLDPVRFHAPGDGTRVSVLGKSRGR
jgi:hypothetical protein